MRPFSMMTFSICTSMFPPLSTMPMRSPALNLTLLCRILATPTAPAPSTTIFCVSSRNKIAFAISSSSTCTNSSTHSRIFASVVSLASRTAIPSAIVRTVFEFMLFLALKLLNIAGAPFALTATTRMSGFTCFTQLDMPLISPPPPTGTIIVSSSARSSSISSPTVPCPAITYSSSNGWIKLMPCCLAYSTA